MCVVQGAEQICYMFKKIGKAVEQPRLPLGELDAGDLIVINQHVYVYCQAGGYLLHHLHGHKSVVSQTLKHAANSGTILGATGKLREKAVLILTGKVTVFVERSSHKRRTRLATSLVPCVLRCVFAELAACSEILRVQQPCLQHASRSRGSKLQKFRLTWFRKGSVVVYRDWLLSAKAA